MTEMVSKGFQPGASAQAIEVMKNLLEQRGELQQKTEPAGGQFERAKAEDQQLPHQGPDDSNESQRIEEQHLKEEFEIHLENVKKEAVDLFDQERYQDSLGMFSFLCELEPENRRLRDYFELSQQMVREAELAQAGSSPQLRGVRLCRAAHQT